MNPAAIFTFHEAVDSMLADQIAKGRLIPASPELTLKGGFGYWALPWPQFPVAYAEYFVSGESTRYTVNRGLSESGKPNGVFIAHESYSTPVWFSDESFLEMLPKNGQLRLNVAFKKVDKTTAFSFPEYNSPQCVQGVYDGAFRQKLINWAKAVGSYEESLDEETRWKKRKEIIQSLSAPQALVYLESAVKADNAAAFESEEIAPIIRITAEYFQYGVVDLVLKMYSGSILGNHLGWILKEALPYASAMRMILLKNVNPNAFQIISDEQSKSIAFLKEIGVWSDI